MTAEAVGAAELQAVDFTEKLIDKYGASVAAGEVGLDGSGTASDAPILANRSPTMLLYGRVQSGKTAAMVLTSALCFDNGFRVIVVLTSDNVALVEQTANRLRALSGPRVFSTRRTGGRYEWEGLEAELGDSVSEDGIVLVSAKNDMHLGQVMTFLQQIDAPSYPTLIFDDEADAATPDTTVKARAEGNPNAPDMPSAINRRVFENMKLGQEGESLGEIFPHKLYVQVTATPIAAVQGIAAGGGLELTLACDLVVAGERATFLAPVLGHGVIPPLGIALLPQIVRRHRAMDMMLTRRKVDAEEALRIGLATHRAGGDDIIAAAVTLAH